MLAKRTDLHYDVDRSKLWQCPRCLVCRAPFKKERSEAMLNKNNLWARIPLAMSLWALGMAILGSSAHGGDIDFNPTGAIGGQVYTIRGIDPGPGNALAVGAVPLTVGATFQLDFQATVSDLVGINGMPIVPPGMTSSFQLTTVGSFTEVVTGLQFGTLANFAVAPVQSPNSFFEMYYNPAVVADSLAGTGFNVGTLILAGTPSTTVPSLGVYSLATDSAGNPVTKPFDQFISDHYPGISTVAGSGSALLAADVTFLNTDFFKTPFSQIFFNSSLITPFDQVSPSGLFTGLPGGGAPNITPNIGTVNGQNGPDFQFQADANLSFGPVIPEPASIIQASLGLLAVLGLAAWVRR
jgi:hypothetical protein